MIKVFVQKLSGQEPQIFEIDRQCTVGFLKQSIQERDPAACAGVAINLLNSESVLCKGDDEKTLEECGVVDGCTLVSVKQKVAAVLTASNDRTAKLWSAATGECTQTFSGHGGGVHSAVFSGQC